MKKRTLGMLSAVAVVALFSVTVAEAANWGSVKGYVKAVNLVETTGSASTPAVQITFDRAGTFCDSSSGQTVTSDTITILRSESESMFDSWVRAAQSAYLSGKPLKVRTQGSCRTAYVVQCADLNC